MKVLQVVLFGVLLGAWLGVPQKSTPGSVFGTVGWSLFSLSPSRSLPLSSLSLSLSPLSLSLYLSSLSSQKALLGALRSSLKKKHSWEHSAAPGKLPDKGKFPKEGGEGAKGLLDPGSKGHPRVFCTTQNPQTSFARVQPHCAPVQEAFCSLSPEELLHPLLTTFGDFPFSGYFPGLWLPNAGLESSQGAPPPIRKLRTGSVQTVLE